MTSTRTEIPKLNGKNWSTYKLKIRAVMRQYDLIRVIDRADDTEESDSESSTSKTSKKAKKTNDDDDDEEDQKKRDKAYGILITSLDDSRAHLVMHISEGDAAGVWRTLCSHYERKSTASKAHTRKLLHNEKMNENEEFDLYKSRIMELKLRLVSMGEPVTDGEMIYVVLEGLPNSYSALKQSLEVQDDYPFEKICGHIRDHQEKEGYKGARMEMDQEVNFAHMKINGRGGRNGNGNYNGNYGNGNVPVGMDRPRWNGRLGGNGNDVAEFDDRSNWPCRLCRKVGHEPRDCPQRKGRGYECFKCGRGNHHMRECPEMRRGGSISAATMWMEESEEENF